MTQASDPHNFLFVTGWGHGVNSTPVHVDHHPTREVTYRSDI